MLLGVRELIAEALNITVRSLPEVLEHTDLSESWVTSGALLKVVRRNDLVVDEATLAGKLVDWACNTQEPTPSVDRVMRYISWEVVYEDNRALFQRAVDRGLFPDDLLVTGADGQMAPDGNNIPESMRLRCHAFALHQSTNSSPFNDVGPPREIGNVRWRTFEGVPSPEGIKLGYEDSIEVEDPNGRLNATKRFSVELWVRRDVGGLPHEHPLVCKAGMGCGWELRTSNYMVQFLVTLRNRDGDQWHETIGMSVDHDPHHWYHIIATFDGRASMLYVDGSSEGVTRLSDWNTQGGDHRAIDADCEIIHFDEALCIGQHSLSGWKGERSFKGDISGLSISTNRVLMGGQN